VRIALGIVRLFPEGGLQRDCMQLARILGECGHDVHIFAARRDGLLNPALRISVLPSQGLTNHMTDSRFATAFLTATRGQFDRVVGFNKLLGLDVLYCADPPFVSRPRGMLLRALPRHRVQVRLESASFAPQARTRIIALTPQLVESYTAHWRTPPERFMVLPPGIDPVRRQPHLRDAPNREVARAALDLPPERRVWLWIGVQPYQKGLDRVIAALEHEPQTLLLTAGVGARSNDARLALALASRIGAADRIRFLGHREDVAALMAAADVLVHPARQETTGQVVLEAVVNGLPAVVSDICGFAEHVRVANAGIVLPGPFAQGDLVRALMRVRDPQAAAAFSRNGIVYGGDPALFSGLSVAADFIASATSCTRLPETARERALVN
jgi:UDP-glucose:(heptosyl)LPS alpha-1,3-glucosyltransferase